MDVCRKLGVITGGPFCWTECACPRLVGASRCGVTVRTAKSAAPIEDPMSINGRPSQLCSVRSILTLQMGTMAGPLFFILDS
jgi:hypothetical protein